ncbi:hypothetical protein SAPIO_CDS4742 [Scedosporium apiospermum]|uniref:DUF7025 domain-containing protein n=1 Tax=Pseudallescheria apiosperma TaxID=563466 RepID=A0A084G7I6_PSEDA|nr:uncharacterized protein SAPIO_CDS4742 [Scedosporium apiospermum]KEZ43298.1 hypothetical protein SAPIO_CDS4742 [Scedosporium apiospermum]
MDSPITDDSLVVDFTLSFEDYVKQLLPASVDDTDADSSMKCEITEYDSIPDSEGVQIVVPGGTHDGLGLLKHAKDDSAIARTTFWDLTGIKGLVQTEIRSPYMKAALKAVVPEYMHRNFDFNHIIYFGKPRHLFHYRNQLFTYGGSLGHQSTAQRHVSLLMEYLQQELADAITAYTFNVQFESQPSIDFAHLWTIFKPNDLVFVPAASSRNGADIVVRYESIASSCSCDRVEHRISHIWTLTGAYFDTNGVNLGNKTLVHDVTYFAGFRRLNHLAVIPLRFHPQESSIRTRLIARGRKFVALQGCHYRRIVSGVSPRGSASENPYEPPSRPRVMVDPEMYHEKKSFEPVGNPIPVTAALEEEHYLICSGHIGGYSLAEREWRLLEVERLEPVDFDKNSFKNSLILETKYKNALLSLIQMQSAKCKDRFRDVIRGKGDGVVFLLHGEPGVGKTMTAGLSQSNSQKLMTLSAYRLGSLSDILFKRALQSAARDHSSGLTRGV